MLPFDGEICFVFIGFLDSTYMANKDKYNIRDPHVVNAVSSVP